MTNTDADLIADPDVQRLWDAAPLMPKLKGIIRDTRLTLNEIGFALATAQEEAIMDATAQAIVNMVQKHLTAEGATGVPEGWKLVPERTTNEMFDAWADMLPYSPGTESWAMARYPEFQHL